MRPIIELYRETYGRTLYAMTQEEVVKGITEDILKAEKERMVDRIWTHNDGDNRFFRGSDDPSDYLLRVTPQAGGDLLLEVHYKGDLQ